MTTPHKIGDKFHSKDRMGKELKTYNPILQG